MYVNWKLCHDSAQITEIPVEGSRFPVKRAPTSFKVVIDVRILSRRGGSITRPSRAFGSPRSNTFVFRMACSSGQRRISGVTPAGRCLQNNNLSYFTHINTIIRIRILTFDRRLSRPSGKQLHHELGQHDLCVGYNCS